ncbi:TolC family outer membrane protein [Ferrovibrio sp.]|uniref:TolC family outer membrane protein n=1 Tax=Ferrovibrio sp. TaxID=1917215 RepID=UPI003D2CEADF
MAKVSFLRGALLGSAAILSAAWLLAAPQAGAQSLNEVLSNAYSNNPTLGAARAAVRATDEGVPQALSGWRPTVSLTGEAGVLRQDYKPNTASTTSDTINPTSLGVSVSQPLYRGGRVEALTDSAEALVQAARQDLASTERRVLQDSVTAYMDVLRDQAVVDLTRNNEGVLRRQLEATRERFRVGEITRTDVAQAESRLSRATADRISAEGALLSSRATFTRITGLQPGRLVPPPPLPTLPTNEDEALAIGDKENPELQAAQFRELSARADVRAASGALLPSVSLNASAARTTEQSRADLDLNTARASIQVTVPLYEAGGVYSQTRQRKQTFNQRRIQVDEQRRLVRQSVTQAWENLNTARSNINARKAQVQASRIALEGVQQEAEVGSRTTLDVLDAEQEYLDAQVAQVRAERDEYVAGFVLYSAVGRLSARNLSLPVQLYDPAENYTRVRDLWFGTDGGLDVE